MYTLIFNKIYHFALDSTTGESRDYLTGVLGVKYGVIPETRGPWFSVEPEKIEFSYQEIWAGFKAGVREIELIEN